MLRRTAVHVAVLSLAATGFAGCGGSDTAVPRQSPQQAARPADTGAASAAAPGEEWADHTQGLPFVNGYQNGLKAAREQGKPAMMFVTTTWCGWCKKLAKENFNDPEIRSLLGGFVCVIVDGDTEQAAKTQLGATSGYPHVVFVSQSGRKVGECLGYEPVQEFQGIVEAAIAQAGAAPRSAAE